MTKTSIDFNVCDMVRIKGSSLPPNLVKALLADYGHFMESGNSPATQLSIKPISELNIPDRLFQKRKNRMERHYVLEHENKLYAVRLHRNKPDCILSLQAPYTLYFTDHKDCASVVLDMLFTGVDIVLRDTANALLCKGAVVVRNGRAAVLTGISGAGKTSILMNLLHEGWSYLSDNTFILHKGQALCFRRHLVMHRYHLQKFSHIYRESKPEKTIKKLLRQTLYRLLPHMPASFRYSQKLNRLANPYIRVTPEDFHSDINVICKAPISNWVCLNPADRFSYAPLSQEQFTDQLQAVLDMTHIPYHNLRRLSVLHSKYSLDQEHKILNANIGPASFHTASLSGPEKFQQEYLRFKNEINTIRNLSKAGKG